MEPDNNHLHHLFFYFLKKKFKVKNLVANNVSSLIILLFNFILFKIGSIDIYSSNKQCFLILTSIFLYILFYYYLTNWKKKLINTK